ncbi:hypothetical protein OIU34_20805 [Pararhizobium sp. BT-229]|uniref:hypothetical protein n=1 Tax=Pararhizobium sp. BT-229 TaxID=2986923 RepID=UPI0021F73CC0|nr:hypothetical protein [Pararhizobium sp. BT-229]MCV9964331.1 hypothetical protein [Pararhizobium sp. BT-229]
MIISTVFPLLWPTKRPKCAGRSEKIFAAWRGNFHVNPEKHALLTIYDSSFMSLIQKSNHRKTATRAFRMAMDAS